MDYKAILVPFLEEDRVVAIPLRTLPCDDPLGRDLTQ
jgi:hypothetical protein